MAASISRDNVSTGFTEVLVVIPTWELESLHSFINFSNGDILEKREVQGGNANCLLQINEVSSGLGELEDDIVTSAVNNLHENAVSCPSEHTAHNDLSMAPVEQADVCFVCQKETDSIDMSCCIGNLHPSCLQNLKILLNSICPQCKIDLLNPPLGNKTDMQFDLQRMKQHGICPVCLDGVDVYETKCCRRSLHSKCRKKLEERNTTRCPLCTKPFPEFRQDDSEDELVLLLDNEFMEDGAVPL